MNTLFIIPALFLGLASSLHCVGMCGPLSLSVPLRSGGKSALNVYIYQAGRIFTYVMVGLVAGVLGRGVLLSGYQQSLSILMGLVLLLIAAGFLLGKKGRSISFFKGYYLFISRLVSLAIQKASEPGGAFLFGMANGLLPCGMVYIAALSSLSLGNVYDSGLFMLFFGAGTLPAMLAIAFVRHKIGFRRLSWLKSLTPGIMFVMGVLLVVRGLNLDIPYLSPFFSTHTGEVLPCH
ncbi:MAG: sulfite exporter TauE/SafE family protein [Chitinophagaceae bacterium]|nr:sulfite exporter TauE/SafE family protein [Chitinophagaceae bacterium]